MVADIRSQGLSKLQLWKHFSLDLLNAYLSGDAPSVREMHSQGSPGSIVAANPWCPSPFKLVKFFVGDGNGKRPKASLLPVEYDFGAKSIGSPETSVEILVMNTGLVPLEWMMLMPSDLEVFVLPTLSLTALWDFQGYPSLYSCFRARVAKQIEVERWVDTDDIIPTDQQSQKTIVENKLFTMTPRVSLVTLQRWYKMFKI
jgi:hypothetical protein